MEQSEITIRNKEIAQMLNWVYVSSIDVKENKYPKYIKSGWYKYIPKIAHEKLENTYYVGRNNFALKFHSDWNMLMEAVEFITLKNWSYDMYCPSDITYSDGEFECNFWDKINPEVMGRSKSSLKEAVFIAISDFAKKFNNKEI